MNIKEGDVVTHGEWTHLFGCVLSINDDSSVYVAWNDGVRSTEDRHNLRLKPVDKINPVALENPTDPTSGDGYGPVTRDRRFL